MGILNRDIKDLAKGAARGTARGVVKGAKAVGKGVDKAKQARADAKGHAAKYVDVIAKLNLMSEHVLACNGAQDKELPSPHGIKLTYTHRSEKIRIIVGKDKDKMSGVKGVLETVGITYVYTDDHKALLVSWDVGLNDA